MYLLYHTVVVFLPAQDLCPSKADSVSKAQAPAALNHLQPAGPSDPKHTRQTDIYLKDTTLLLIILPLAVISLPARSERAETPPLWGSSSVSSPSSMLEMARLPLPPGLCLGSEKIRVCKCVLAYSVTKSTPKSQWLHQVFIFQHCYEGFPYFWPEGTHSTFRLLQLEVFWWSVNMFSLAH